MAEECKNMKKLLSICFIFMLILQLFAAADQNPAEFEVKSKDESKVFRFKPSSNDPLKGTATAGLYKGSNPTEVIYTVENLRSRAYREDFYFSEDLMSFFFVPKDDLEIALEYYSRGKLEKTYEIKDLVNDLDIISNSDSKSTWLKPGSKIVQTLNTLTFTTIDDLTYYLDIATGDIFKVDKKKDSFFDYFLKAMPFLIIILSVGGYLAFFILKQQQKPFLYIL